jgi:hypothetical protein
MSELKNTSELAAAAGCAESVVAAALKAASIEPAYTRRSGRGTMRLYTGAAALEAIRGHLAATAKPEAVTSDLVPAAIVRAVAEVIAKDAFQRDHTLATIEAVGKDSLETIEKALELTAKVSDQNALIFRGLKTMEESLIARFDRMLAVLTASSSAPPPSGAQAPAAESAQPRAPAPTPSPADKALPRVAVLGTYGAIRATVEREFRDCFDLRFYDMPSAKNKTFEQTIAACACVVVVGASVPATVNTALRTAGVRTLRVTGGLTMLRDKLTTLYVEQSEGVAA